MQVKYESTNTNHAGEIQKHQKLQTMHVNHKNTNKTNTGHVERSNKLPFLALALSLSNQSVHNECASEANIG